MNLQKMHGQYKQMGAPAKAAIWFVVCNVIQKSMYFILIPIFTRMMTTFEYGQYSIFTSWELIFAVFAGLNLAGNSYNVGMIKHENDQERYTSAIQGLWWAVTVTVGFVVLITHTFWEGVTKLSFSLLLAVFIHILATGSIDLWTAKQRYHYKYKGVLLLTSCLVVLTIIVSIFMISHSESKDSAAVWSKVGVLLFLGIITAFINIYHGKTIFHKEYWIQGLKFNIPLIAYYLSLIVLSQSDRIMINNYCGVDKAGIYSVANSLAHILVLLNTAINGSFVPWEYRKIKTKDYNAIPGISNILLLLIGVLNLLLVGVAPEIIHIMTTPDYFSAIWVVPPIAISSFFAFAYQLFVNIEFYHEKKFHVMVASIGVSVLNIVLNAIFIPKYGFIAAGYTTVTSYVTFTFVHYIFMKHVCKQVGERTDIYNIKQLLTICIAMIAAMFVFIGLYAVSPLIRYIVIISAIFLTAWFIKTNKKILFSVLKRDDK